MSQEGNRLRCLKWRRSHREFYNAIQREYYAKVKRARRLNMRIWAILQLMPKI